MSKNKNVGYVHTLKTGAWTSSGLDRYKNNRGSNKNAKAGALLFGFLLVVGLESLLIYLALAILRNAEIIDWSPSVLQIFAFSVVSVLYRFFHRATFHGALATREGKAV